jgi:hypothetical protein
MESREMTLSVNTSRPSETGRPALSSIRQLPPSAISATIMRRPVEPISTAATTGLFSGIGYFASSPATQAAPAGTASSLSSEEAIFTVPAMPFIKWASIERRAAGR